MLEQIREIIAENLAIDVEKVTESEDEYEIEIPEEDLPTLKTVGDVVKYVENHQK